MYRLEICNSEDGSVDVKLELMQIVAWMTVLWQDPRLRWDPEKYGGIRVLSFEPHTIWVPRLFLENPASGNLFDASYNDYFSTLVTFEGEVTWEPGGEFATSCNFNTRAYPFDSQSCPIFISLWTVPTSMVNMTAVDGEDGQDRFTAQFLTYNGEWEFLGVNITNFNFVEHVGTGYEFSTIIYELSFRRRSAFFLLNLIIPMIILFWLGSLVYVIPLDSGERITTGVTLLISFTFFLLIVFTNVPSKSVNLPVIDLLLISLMAYQSWNVAISKFLCNIYSRDGTEAPPLWLQCISFQCIGRILPGSLKPPSPPGQSGIYSNNQIFSMSRLSTIGDGTKDEQATVANPNHEDGAHNENDIKAINESSEEINKKLWKNIALMLNSFCMVCSIVVLFVTTLVVLTFYYTI